MSQANPASTESAAGGRCRPIPRATAPRRRRGATSATAMTSSSAVRSGSAGGGRPRWAVPGRARVSRRPAGHRGSSRAVMAGRGGGAAAEPTSAAVGASVQPTASLGEPWTTGLALKSGFSQLAPISG